MTESKQQVAATDASRTALSFPELAKRWGVCRQSLYNMAHDGELQSFKVRRRRLVSLSEIERIERGEAA